MTAMDIMLNQVKQFTPDEIRSLFEEAPNSVLAKLSNDILFEITDDLYLGWKLLQAGRYGEVLVLCNTKTKSFINIQSAELTSMMTQLLTLANNKTIDEKFAAKDYQGLNFLVDTDTNSQEVTISQINFNNELGLSISFPQSLCGTLAYSMLLMSTMIGTKLRCNKPSTEVKLHPNHKMIVTKSENTDIVIFGHRRGIGFDYWCEHTLVDLVNRTDMKFFLCHPKHKDACDHWLNGGQAEAKSKEGWKNARTSKEWDCRTVYMNPDIEIRKVPLDLTKLTFRNIPNIEHLNEDYL